MKFFWTLVFLFLIFGTVAGAFFDDDDDEDFDDVSPKPVYPCKEEFKRIANCNLSVFNVYRPFADRANFSRVDMENSLKCIGKPICRHSKQIKEYLDEMLRFAILTTTELKCVTAEAARNATKICKVGDPWPKPYIKCFIDKTYNQGPCVNVDFSGFEKLYDVMEKFDDAREKDYDFLFHIFKAMMARYRERD